MYRPERRQRPRCPKRPYRQRRGHFGKGHHKALTLAPDRPQLKSTRWNPRKKLPRSSSRGWYGGREDVAEEGFEVTDPESLFCNDDAEGSGLEGRGVDVVKEDESSEFMDAEGGLVRIHAFWNASPIA